MPLRGTYGSYNQADGVITASTPLDKNGLVRVGGSLRADARRLSARI
jgi:iron complex outermembrane receptor protein